MPEGYLVRAALPRGRCGGDSKRSARLLYYQPGVLDFLCASQDRFFKRDGAVGFSAAVAAILPRPDLLNHVYNRIDHRHLVDPDPGFEVAPAGALGSEPRSGKIRRTQIHPPTVHDDGFEVNARTATHAHSRREAVLESQQEWFAGDPAVQESDLDPACSELAKHFQNALCGPSGRGRNMDILDVRRHYYQAVPARSYRWVQHIYKVFHIQYQLHHRTTIGRYRLAALLFQPMGAKRLVRGSVMESIIKTATS